MRAHLRPRSCLLPVVVASFAAVLGGALPSLAEKSPQCRELAVSVLPAPPSYAAECGETIALPPPALDAPSLPGDQVFYLNLYSLGPNAQSVLKAPLPTFAFTTVGPQTGQIFAMDFDNDANTLWAVHNQTREVGTIDQTNGAFTATVPVTGIPAAETITGMSFDPETPNVWLTTTEGSPATIARLYKINLGTGVATFVGPIGGFPAMAGIAISNTGQMYGHDLGGDRIVGIDKNTAIGWDVGTTGFDCNFAQGLDFDSSTNTMYLMMHLGASAQSRLASVNLLMGTATILQFASQAELEGTIKAAVPDIGAIAYQIYLDPLGNGVLDPGETAEIQPSWLNIGKNPIDLTGTATSFTGPFGPTYNLTDSSGNYGQVAARATATCASPCYTVDIQGARPVPHWDATLTESLPTIGATRDWNIHVGASFNDVSPMSPFYKFIESLFHRGITGGCGGGNYCPGNPVPREQMSVFVVEAKYGLAQPCGLTSIFGDVNPASPFCPFIEELFRRGVVTGCGGGNFCPTAPTTREQMAVFLLRTLFGVDYTPPDCGTPVFNDVPASSPFCRWVEDLSRRGITAGCGNGNYCPTDPVLREQMAVFVDITFARAAF